MKTITQIQEEAGYNKKGVKLFKVTRKDGKVFKVEGYSKADVKTLDPNIVSVELVKESEDTIDEARKVNPDRAAKAMMKAVDMADKLNDMVIDLGDQDMIDTKQTIRFGKAYKEFISIVGDIKDSV